MYLITCPHRPTSVLSSTRCTLIIRADALASLDQHQLVGQAQNSAILGQNPLNVAGGECVTPRLTLPCLVQAKKDGIEVHACLSTAQAKALKTDVHLHLVKQIQIYGEIHSVHSIRPQGSVMDSILVMTRDRLFTLSYSTQLNSFETKSCVDTTQNLSRDLPSGIPITLIDDKFTMILHYSKLGFMFVIPIQNNDQTARDSRALPSATFTTVAKKSTNGQAAKRAIVDAVSGDLGEVDQVKLPSFFIVSMVLLKGTAHLSPSPILMILQKANSSGPCKLRSYALENNTLSPWQFSVKDLDESSYMIIPISPLPTGQIGVIIFSQIRIQLVLFQGSSGTDRNPPAENPVFTTDAPQFPFSSFASFDASRHLLGDINGGLYLLSLISEPTNNTIFLSLDWLGAASISTTMTYLHDEGFVFVGSHSGDSTLLSLQSNLTADQEFVETQQVFPGTAPATDFLVTNIDQQGQGKLFVCSGIGKDGSVRIISKGIGVEEIGCLDDIVGIRKTWSLPGLAMDDNMVPYHNVLVLSFATQTRFQYVDGSVISELPIIDGMGWIESEPTLYCQLIPQVHSDPVLLQMTPSKLRFLANDGTYELLCEWCPPQGYSVLHGTSSGQRIVIALTRGLLIALTVANNGDAAITARVLKQYEFSNEISALSISSCEQYISVGLWKENVVISLSTTDLGKIDSFSMTDVMPRSLLFQSMAGELILFVASGDGQIMVLKVTGGKLSLLRRISVGHRMIELIPLTGKSGRPLVLAACDTPSVLYWENGSIAYSSLAARDVLYATPFHTAMSPGGLVYATENELKIGVMEAVDKLHIQSVYLGETARRIAFNQVDNKYGVATMAESETTEFSGYFKLLGADCQVLDTLALREKETPVSLVCGMLGDSPSPVFVLGTACTDAMEEEPSRGRLLVLAHSTKSDGSVGISLVAEESVKGCPYSLAIIKNRLVMAIGNHIQLLRYSDSSFTVLSRSSGLFVNAIMLQVQDDLILVGDLMKSFHLIRHVETDDTLVDVARHTDPHWPTAMAILDSAHFIGADTNEFLYAVSREIDSSMPHDVSGKGSKHLLTCGSFHLGDQVNQFRSGSLVTAEGLPCKTKLLFVTTHGAIGAISELDDHVFHTLSALQIGLERVLPVFGGLSHASWRFPSPVGSANEEVSIFVDGDFIGRFFELSDEQRADVLKDSGLPSSEADVTTTCQLLESLSRI